MDRNERLCEELDFLRNVYTDDEVSFEHEEGLDAEEVMMTIHPATAGNVEEQYVCLNLQIHLPQQYPEASPVVAIRNPRGLSENEVLRLEKIIDNYINEEKGNPVLMQLFEMVRERLTDTNVPHGVCSICLSDFLDTRRLFLRTDCYHYFHCTCIGKYKAYWEELVKKQKAEPALPAYQVKTELELLCPECRKPILLPDELPTDEDIETELFEYSASETMLVEQEERKKLYEKQLAQGGIIDLEQERQKFRLPPPANSCEVTTADSTCPTDSTGGLNLTGAGVGTAASELENLTISSDNPTASAENKSASVTSRSYHQKHHHSDKAFHRHGDRRGHRNTKEYEGYQYAQSSNSKTMPDCGGYEGGHRGGRSSHNSKEYKPSRRNYSDRPNHRLPHTERNPQSRGRGRDVSVGYSQAKSPMLNHVKKSATNDLLEAKEASSAGQSVNSKVLSTDQSVAAGLPTIQSELSKSSSVENDGISRTATLDHSRGEIASAQRKPSQQPYYPPKHNYRRYQHHKNHEGQPTSLAPQESHHRHYPRRGGSRNLVMTDTCPSHDGSRSHANTHRPTSFKPVAARGSSYSHRGKVRSGTQQRTAGGPGSADTYHGEAETKNNSENKPNGNSAVQSQSVDNAEI